MNLPTVGQQIWLDLIEHKKQIKFEYFAFNIFLGKAKFVLNSDPSKTGELAKELYDLFDQNKDNPVVQNDIGKLG